MAKKNSRKTAARTTRRSGAASSATRAAAHDAARDGRSVKRRVANISEDAFRENDFSLNDLPRVVHDVFSGAVDAIDRNIPASRNNVLREVFDGLSEGFDRVNKATGVMMSGDRSSKNGATERRTGNKGRRQSTPGFLDAVSSFAAGASKRVRDELNSFVDSAEQRTGGRGHAREQASERRRRGDDGIMETAGSAARAGMRMAQRAASDAADMAGRMLDGAVDRAEREDRRPASRSGRTRTSSARGASRPAGKTTATRKAPKRRARP